MKQIQMDRHVAYEELARLLQSDSAFTIRFHPLEALEVNEDLINANPATAFYDQMYQLSRDQLSVERNSWLPDINLTYFTGTNKYEDAQTYIGYQVGLSIPLFFGANAGKTKAAKIGTLIAQSENEQYALTSGNTIGALRSEVQKYREAIRYYADIGRDLSEEILKTAERSYRNGEIGYFEYVQSLENAVRIEMDFLDNLDMHNQAVLELNYFTL